MLFFDFPDFFGPRLAFLIYLADRADPGEAAFAAFNLPWLVGIASMILSRGRP